MAIAGSGILICSSACSATAAVSQETCTFTWSDVQDRDMLTAVSEAKTLAKGEKWVPAMRVVKSGVAQVTGVKLDKPHAAIASLRTRVGHALVPIGRTYPSEVSRGETSFGGAGRFVLYQVTPRLVDADFVVECDGKRLGSGHATSWQDDDIRGTAQCGVETLDDSRVADEALRMAC
ncbi:hypothetical protein ACFQ0B_03560 [Nonomuraea thailandensis]